MSTKGKISIIAGGICLALLAGCLGSPAPQSEIGYRIAPDPDQVEVVPGTTCYQIYESHLNSAWAVFAKANPDLAKQNNRYDVLPRGGYDNWLKYNNPDGVVDLKIDPDGQVSNCSLTAGDTLTVGDITFRLQKPVTGTPLP